MVELMAGFAVFSIIGFIATSRGMALKEAVAGGPGIAFIAYPQAINNLPAGREIFGMIFFLTLILAGFTSAIAIIETFVSAAIDKFGWGRLKLATVVSVVGFLGSIVFTTNAATAWLEIIDYMVCNVGMLLVGLLEAVLVCWVLGGSSFIEKVERYSRLKYGRFWLFAVKVFTPFVLVMLFIAGVVGAIKAPFGGFTWLQISVVGFGWLAATLVAARLFTKAGWRTDHLRHKYHSEDEPIIVEVMENS